jgi:Recombinase zinc beta ribbon domain/Metallopeptidase family M24
LRCPDFWPISARVQFNFETTFSSFEHAKILERVTRGRIKKASLGGLVGNMRPLYGYDLDEYKSNYVLNEYAPIVREVLLSYGMEHVRPTRIADMLQGRGVKTAGRLHYEHLMELYNRKLAGGRYTQEDYDQKVKVALRQLGDDTWKPAQIYVILRNHRAYAGDYVFTVAGKQYHLSVPPIITAEESEAVARMLAVGKRRLARSPRQAEYLMVRRLTCAECGHSYVLAVKRRSNVYYYYRCSGQRTGYNTKQCTNRPVRGEPVDALTRKFIKALLLSPRRLFAWWQQQHEQDEVQNEATRQHIDLIDKRVAATTTKLYKTLDRLTDNLDDDEVAYYEQQRDELKHLLSEYREEREGLIRKLTHTTVDPSFIQSFEEMGEEYRNALETSEDITFWRGLVDDLDLTAIIGTEGDGRRYVDFVLFGRVRKREYLDDDEGEKVRLARPDAEGGLGVTDFSHMEPGMVFTVEPGLYAPELGGFRHSDTVLITEDGIELLTYYPRDLESLIIPA